jgi:hypothetical protein
MKFLERLRRNRGPTGSRTLEPETAPPLNEPATLVSPAPTQNPSNTGGGLGSSIPEPVTTPTIDIAPTIDIEDYGDDERTLLRYRTAVETLRTAANATPSVGWGSLDLSPLDAVGDLDGIDTIRGKIDETLNIHQYRRDHPDRVGKLTAFAEKIFATIGPFTANFLTVAQQAQSVYSSLIFTDMKIPILNPYGILCSGLLLLMSVSSARNSKSTDGRLPRTKLIGRKRLKTNLIIYQGNLVNYES